MDLGTPFRTESSLFRGEYNEHFPIINRNSSIFLGDETEVSEAKQEDGEDVQEDVGQRENEAEEEALQERTETETPDSGSLICSDVP